MNNLINVEWEFNPFNITWEKEDLNNNNNRKLPVIENWHTRVNNGSLDYNTAEKEVLDLLYFLVKSVKPKIIVETGSHNGISALYLAKGLVKDGIVYSIEKNKNKIAVCNKLRKLYNFNIKFIRGDSIVYDWSKFLEKETVDFALIDCWERLPAFMNLLPFLREGAYILFHDTLWFPEYKKDVQTLIDKQIVNSAIDIESNRGLTICRKL